MTGDTHASGGKGRKEEGPALAADRTGDIALQERQAWMSVLAKVDPQELAEKLTGLGDLPPYSVIRPAESGSVMVRGRAGGTGSPFNMGEMSVTRCVVQVSGNGIGTVVGHAYVAGRDKPHAERAALLDALLQTERWAPVIREAVIQPLADAAVAVKQQRQQKVAATKVNFFTMVRGEN